MTRLYRNSPPILRHVLFGALLLLVITPWFSMASPASVSLSITNNSSREIRHVYLAPAEAADNWGPDQLNNSVIATGGTHTLSLSCSGTTVRVIAEDEDGCFYYHVASCSQNGTWTISGDSARDCGNQ